MSLWTQPLVLHGMCDYDYRRCLSLYPNTTTDSIVPLSTTAPAPDSSRM